MNLVELGKICGILFFVVMCWYFIFVVFKTNKDYLRSLAGMDVVEGFSDDVATRLENTNNQLDGLIKQFKEILALAEGGKEEQRKLILDFFEKSIKLSKLMFINASYSIGASDPNNKPQMASLEKDQEKYLKQIKIYEDALTYFTEEQTISENEGLI